MSFCNLIPFAIPSYRERSQEKEEGTGKDLQVPRDVQEESGGLQVSSRSFGATKRSASSVLPVLQVFEL